LFCLACLSSFVLPCLPFQLLKEPVHLCHSVKT